MFTQLRTRFAAIKLLLGQTLSNVNISEKKCYSFVISFVNISIRLKIKSKPVLRIKKGGQSVGKFNLYDWIINTTQY